MSSPTLDLFGFETNSNVCRICRKENDGYIIDGLCIDCDLGLNTGQWIWDKIAEGY